MAVTVIFGAVLLAGLLMLLFTVFTCVWLYRDSRLHGQPPALWVLLAVFASPILALLLYFIFGRKETLEPCQTCGAPVTRTARFCQSCGAENPSFGQPAPKGRPGGLAIAVIVSGAAILLCAAGLLAGMFVCAFSAGGSYGTTGAVAQAGLPIESAMDVNTGWVIMSTEGHRNGVWSFSMSKTSDGYHKTGRFQLDDPHDRILAVDVACEGETLELEVSQNGETAYTETISGAEGMQYFSLAALEPGEVTLRVVNHGATDISGRIWVE